MLDDIEGTRHQFQKSTYSPPIYRVESSYNSFCYRLDFNNSTRRFLISVASFFSQTLHTPTIPPSSSSRRFASIIIERNTSCRACLYATLISQSFACKHCARALIKFCSYCSACVNNCGLCCATFPVHSDTDFFTSWP